MRRLRAWILRVFGTFTSASRERDLHDELASHLQLHIDDNLRAGMTPEEARRQALLKLGGVEATKERYRDRRGLPWMDGLAQDVRFALRTFRRSPGFTSTAVATLAIGIGVNAAVFTVTKAALFEGFPQVVGNDRLLYLSSGRGCCVSYPDYEDWKAQARSFEDMAIVHGTLRVLADPSGFAESDEATEVSPNTFRLVERQPIMGRDFSPADAVPGAPPVAILNYGFWLRRFGKDPGVVGRTIRMNGVPTTVIGVMPPGFSFPQKQDLWVPLMPTPEVRQRAARTLWFAFGRLAAGATIERARAEMDAIGRRLGRAYPLTNQGRNLLPQVQTFREFFIFQNETAVYGAMWGAVAFVLLIACANLANLMLARSIGRSREIAVRIALGAGRWRIVRQLLVESAMLSAAGGAAGWWIAKWSVHAYALADRGPGRSSWRILDYTLDDRVLAYLIAIAVGTAILCGLAPALRLSGFGASAMLKNGDGRAAGGRRGRRLSSALVVGEMALAVVLLSGAGVMIRSFLNVYTAPLGADPTHVLTMALDLPHARYPRPEDQVSFYDRLETRLEARPGVESVAIANALPGGRAARVPYEFAGAPPVEPQLRPTLSALIVGPRYFRTLGATVLPGRAFTDFDRESSAPVALVNQRFARTYWAGEDPLGKRVRLFKGPTPGAWLTVVGVVSNIVQNPSLQEFDPLVYLPYRQWPTTGMEVIARVQVSPAGLTAAFRRDVQALDPGLPVFGPFSLDQRLEANYWTKGLDGGLFLVFAVIALLLASLGLYAVIAHSVTERTQEIGVRMATGATAPDILGLIFRQGMFSVGIGLSIGLLASLAVNPVLKSQLVNVSPADPAALFVASASLILAATLGCLIPARRATRVDPVEALRHE